jgi:hypothetical protein
MLRKLSRCVLAGSLVAVTVAMGACGAARVIQRNQAGGVIELQGDRGKAMEQAGMEMSAHCGPNNFTIVQEGEEVVGQDTMVREDTATDSKTSRSGRRQSTDSATTTTQSTRNATAWRVHYQCGGGAMVGPDGPPPPPGGNQPPPPPPPPQPAGASGW